MPYPESARQSASLPVVARYGPLKIDCSDAGGSIGRSTEVAVAVSARVISNLTMFVTYDVYSVLRSNRCHVESYAECVASLVHSGLE